MTLGLTATIFPQTTAMAATGNLSLIFEMGKLMLIEARALANVAEQRRAGPFGIGAGLFYWSPTMNLGRDPRWGRFQESISEDPWINGAYATAFVQSFQGSNIYSHATDDRYLGVAATCKHFVAYSLEASGNATRHNFDAKVEWRDLVESYLPSFKRCVVEGKPAQIMCAYNSINGTPACLRDDLQNKVARDAWGFEGLIVSDQDVREPSNCHTSV